MDRELMQRVSSLQIYYWHLGWIWPLQCQSRWLLASSQESLYFILNKILMMNQEQNLSVLIAFLLWFFCIILEWVAIPSSKGIFPTQGSNSGLMHCRQILYQLSHKGSLRTLEWVAYPFSSGSSWPRNPIRVSCITAGFFTNWAIREAQMHR